MLVVILANMDDLFADYTSTVPLVIILIREVVAPKSLQGCHNLRVTPCITQIIIELKETALLGFLLTAD